MSSIPTQYLQMQVDTKDTVLSSSSQTRDVDGWSSATSEVEVGGIAQGNSKDQQTIQYTVLQDSLLMVDTLNNGLYSTMDTVNLFQEGISEKLETNLYEENKEGVPLPMMLHRSDGIFILLLFCFFLLAHFYNGGINFIKENIQLVFAPEKSDKLEVQNTTRETLSLYFLVFMSALLISISVYEGLGRFFPLADSEKQPFMRIGIFVILICVFVVLKLALNRLIAYIFGSKVKIQVWNKTYLILLGILGVFCFLPTLALIYFELWHNAMIIFSLFLFLVIQLILWSRIISFFIAQKYSVLSLIAYLCTVEFLPYVYLGLGLFYFYQIDIINTILR